MCSTWFATVFGVTPRRRAISLLAWPRASSAEHLDLAGGEPGRPLASGRRSVTGRAQHGVDRVAVEPPRPRLARRLAAASSASSAGRCGRGSVIAW